MTNKSEVQFVKSGDRPRNASVVRLVNLFCFPKRAAGVLAISLLCSGMAAAQGNSPVQLRQFIGQQVGGIDKLQVPATNAAIPVPPPVAGSGNTPYRYQTTEAKRFLGKQLFHDPVRTVRINENQNQPVDLPVGTAFGGQLQASDSHVQNIVTQTQKTGGCGSCHIAESAGKAGQQVHLHGWGEG